MNTFAKSILSTTLLLLTSCTSTGLDEAVGEAHLPANRLSATVESHTRTELGGLSGSGYKNVWSEGDEIAVFIDGQHTPLKYTLAEGAGENRGIFEGHGHGSSYIAIYPYDENARLSDDGKITFRLPETQIYTEGSFASGAYPMVAVSGDEQLAFKNMASVLKIPVTGSLDVDRIIFTPRSEEIKVAGTALVDTAFDTEPQLIINSESAFSSITLECGGTMLDNEKATDFYMVIPARTYTGGFTITICSQHGRGSRSFTSDIVMARSEMRELKEPIDYDSLFEGMRPSESLEGSGTESDPYLIAGISDLLLMQQRINSLDREAQSAHYLLTQDLDFTEYNLYADSWIPAGDGSNDYQSFFGGVFDGGGHSITNLRIDRPDRDLQGLFGILYGGEIRNLSLSGSIAGNILAGGLVGYSENSVIANCISSATVTGQTFIGGIVGTNGSTSKILNCVSLGAVTPLEEGIAGGICGQNFSTIENCYMLADSGEGTDTVTGADVENGIHIKCFALTRAMMGGEDTGRNLYTTERGSYCRIDKALNAWAYDNGGATAKYCGWKIDETEALPAFGDSQPTLPEPDRESVFSILRIFHSLKEFAAPSFKSDGGTFGTIEWGDGTVDNLTPSTVHTYSDNDRHTVTVKVDEPTEVRFDNISGVSAIDFSEF